MDKANYVSKPVFTISHLALWIFPGSLAVKKLDKISINCYNTRNNGVVNKALGPWEMVIEKDISINNITPGITTCNILCISK